MWINRTPQHGGIWRGKSSQNTTSSKVKSPPDSSYETLLRQLKASAHTSNNPSPKNVSFDMPTTSPSGIPGVGGSPPPIPPVAALVSTPEIMSAPDPTSWYAYDILDEERRQMELGLQNAANKLEKSMDAYNLLMDSLGITRAAANHPP